MGKLTATNHKGSDLLRASFWSNKLSAPLALNWQLVFTLASMSAER
jgi:hypothetical protein